MIALIACGAKKLDHVARARDLYTGALFQKSLAYVERRGAAAIFVISAKHGLIPIDREIEPYDLKLDDLSRAEAMRWLRKLGHQMRYDVPPTRHLLVLAGAPYANAIAATFDLGMMTPDARIERPLDGMQIGERLAWLTRALASDLRSRSEVA